MNGEKFSVDQLRKQTEPESEQEIINSAPNSPAPIARFKQMVTENEHLLLEEDSKINKEISLLNQVLEKTKDWEERSRTRSQSSGTGGSKKDQKTSGNGGKTKKGG